MTPQPETAPAPPYAPPPELRVRPRVVFGIWTVVGLFFVSRGYLLELGRGAELSWRPIAVPMLDAYVWATFTPLILWLAGRFRFRRGRWPLSLLVHFAAGAAMSVTSVTINHFVEQALYGDAATGYWRFLRSAFHWNLEWYMVIVGIRHALEYYQRFRDRDLDAARLGRQLAQARVEALRMQIQPHFLFNTLNSISELVHEDPDAADRMISRLGDLLRLTLDTEEHEVPLRREVELLAAYLEIQQVRFADRLTVEFRLEPETMDALVPNLLLQPLVENAIRHGTSQRAGPGRIEVSSARGEGGTLHLEVRDNGAGLSARQAPGRRGGGVGLRNTRDRLQQLYGGEHRFEVADAPGGGVSAKVDIPFRPAPSASPDTRTAPAGEGAGAAA